MTGIIITGHGTFASGLSANIKMLAGNSIELTALDFTDQKPPEVLEEEIAVAIEKYDSSSVFTDIVNMTMKRANPLQRGKGFRSFRTDCVTL